MRLAYGIPCYRGQVHVGHVGQTLALSAVANALGAPILLTWADSCSLAWARNHLLHWSIKQSANWLLMTDADTFCLKREAIAGMLGEGVRQGAAVIAAPVRMRNRNGFNVSREIGEDEAPVPEDEFRGTVVPVDLIGTGFFAVNCNWVREHLPQPWFTQDQIAGDPPAWAGEDFAFCRKVRRAGGLILADGRFEPVHVGATSETSAFLDAGALLYERPQ